VAHLPLFRRHGIPRMTVTIAHDRRPGEHQFRRSWIICRDVLMRTAAEIIADRIPSVAAGVTFFILLALFPAIASVVSLFGLFADRTSIAHLVDHAAAFLPGGAVTVLDAELHRLIAQKPGRLDLAFLIGLVVAVWSASGGITSLADGLNVAYELRETRSFLRLTVHALLATAACVLFAACMIELAVVLPVMLRHLAFHSAMARVFSVLRWPAVFLVCVLMLDVFYTLVPNRRPVRWQWVSWGSATASLLWVLGTLLFGWYVRNFGSYDRVYGDLGAAVGFLSWIWLSLMILLAGAELNCEIARSRSAGKIEPRSARIPVT
jgi:membrane protein